VTASPPSRRTVLAAAWAAPVVVIAATAPGASASTPPTPIAIDSIDVIVVEEYSSRVSIRVEITGTDLPEVMSGSWETEYDPFSEFAQGFIQAVSTDGVTATSHFDIEGNNFSDIDYHGRVTVYFGQSVGSADYTRPPT
jgi:hypothetical protein